MNFDLALLFDAFLAMSKWEIVAVILGILYVILAAKESAWCWVSGFFSTLIYTILFWEGQLLSSALLNFYYMGMSIYGFILWKRGTGKGDEELPITSWPLSKHIIGIVIAMLFGLVVGYLLTTYTSARLPYLDATVMVFSIFATWMLAQKILANWLYWIFIDTAAITLYWSTGYYVTIILFMVYVMLSVYGYISWRKSKSGV
ncbi:nicotinamide riboside transporter PnuC [Sulfurovum sp. zt1-1]|uniref:Nicotinamide riboside transporter PnuC n=1 Tax=Sulfurovum zhangzhouensis TaxID=3019067 RepID=A0ABT7QZB3_9BACT|nr:nicotinamide riboside transporter PnuC [Sulfurovum zhangzhouensis]MDM5272153.1 nicotinamide riboside transporter PnuC [Sulfurovum zhangzhouensis]